MEIGMLWFDDGPAKLRERVQRAAEYYTDKYGHKPNLCLVHPGMLSGEADKFNGVQVRPAGGLMKGHLWLGVEEAAKANGANGKGGKSNGTQAKRTSGKARTGSGKSAKANGAKKPRSKASGAKRGSKKKAD